MTAGDPRAQERALLFDSAMEDHRAGLHSLAVRTLHQLVADGSPDPLHWSYLGLLSAMTERSYQEAAILCRRAVERDGRRRSELYLNLARVLEMSGDRGEAVAVLSKGLSVHREDPSLRSELQRLAPRAQASLPLPSHRGGPVGKYLGIARTVGARLWTTFIPRVRRVERRRPRAETSSPDPTA